MSGAAAQTLPPIVFSHANSFPAGTYAQLFARWRAAGHAVHAIEKIGHDPRYPPTGNWPHLADELLALVERERCAPAYLVGHSLGGFLSLLAATRQPEIARGIVLLDSPLIDGWRAAALRFFKATGFGERFSPGHVSKRRRQSWPSVDAAQAHFAAKPAFAAFAPGVLPDYVAAGIAGDEREAYLAFDRGIETTIYNTLPDHIGKLLRARPLGCPIAFVGGTHSHEIRRAGLAATRRETQGRLSMLEGSHLFPLEHPLETADEVLRWLGRFAAERAGATAPPSASL